MIDYIVLCSFRPFAVIMQKYPGWIGFLQTQFLDSIGCIWFNRTEMKDRALVQARMRRHVRTEGNVPLLIFPEGTCVNNEYIVMFKKVKAYKEKYIQSTRTYASSGAHKSRIQTLFLSLSCC